MVKKIINLFLFIAVFSILLGVGCGPSEPKGTIYYQTNTYPHPDNLKVPVALFVKERNGNILFGNMASVFLIDKERGLFCSARHFVGLDENTSYKLFFNGRVYKISLINMPAIKDFFIAQIDGDFNPDEFPDPYPIGNEPKKGDKVFVQGIHLHPVKFQKDVTVIKILQEYYGMDWMSKKGELVFESLPAEVVNTNYIVDISKIGGQVNMGSTFARFIRVKTEKDHGFSFAGLSGGPVINQNKELVGIVSFEKRDIEQVKDLFVFIVVKFKYQYISMVPVQNLKEMMLDLGIYD